MTRITPTILISVMTASGRLPSASNLGHRQDAPFLYSRPVIWDPPAVSPGVSRRHASSLRDHQPDLPIHIR